LRFQLDAQQWETIQIPFAKTSWRVCPSDESLVLTSFRGSWTRVGLNSGGPEAWGFVPSNLRRGGPVQD